MGTTTAPQDLLLSAPYLITMNNGERVIEDGALVVRGTKIVDVGPRAAVERRSPHATIRHFANRVLMPGLINSHLHSGLLRGTAEGLPVWDWLRMFVDPMHRVIHACDAEAASWLCYAEAVLSGTTTVVDMWRYMAGSGRAAHGIGNRAVLVPYVGEHPEYDYFESLDDNEKLIQEWHGACDGRIKVWVGLEHLFYTDEKGYGRAIDLARRYDTGFHTHSNEAEVELAEMKRRYGMRPIQAMKKLGFFDTPKVMLAHCVWLDDAEIAILAEEGIGVVHNPVSNMKLASGSARVVELLNAGVPVSLGTDGEKENNNLDMFDDMKTASLLAKLKAGDASALDSWRVLEMATVNGARCLGLEGEIGRLARGMRADVIAVRTDTPRMTPLMSGEYFNLHHNLVHAVRGSDVDMTMVDGRIVVDGGRLLTADLHALIAEVQRLVPDLFARRAKYLKANVNGASSPV